MLHRIALVAVSIIGLCLGAVEASAPASTETLRLANVFGDYMVLQRDVMIPVFGQASPGKQVKVTLGDGHASASAGKSGNWQVKLPPMKAGGPFELAVVADGTSVVLHDVLMGDVWVCSGQSNMAFVLNGRTRGVADAKAEAARANYPNLRLMKVPRFISFQPLQDLRTPSKWEPCNPQTVSDFSAVGYYFGSNLQTHLNVPIGLIESSWGGTEAESWTSEQTLLTLPTSIGKRIRQQREAGNDRASLKALLHRQQQAWDARALAADREEGVPICLCAASQLRHEQQGNARYSVA